LPAQLEKVWRRKQKKVRLIIEASSYTKNKERIRVDDHNREIVFVDGMTVAIDDVYMIKVE